MSDLGCESDVSLVLGRNGYLASVTCEIVITMIEEQLTVPFFIFRNTSTNRLPPASAKEGKKISYLAS